MTGDMKTGWIGAMVLLLAISCSKDEDKKTEGTSSEDTAPETAASESASDGNPCDILTETAVRKHLKIADDVKIDQRLSSPGGHAHCSYNWSTLTPEEEQEQGRKIAEEAMARAQNRGKSKAGATQAIVEMATRKNFGRGSAHLTMTKEMASEKAAVSALASARSYMETRAKAKVGDQDVDFTSPMSDVAGVGSKAHYTAKQRQISLAYGKRLYHLGATPDREGDSLEIVTTIAKELFP